MPASAPGGERLSSAILYAAIIAIWAGVLIPRWLRRDSSSSSSGATGASGASDASGASGGEAVDEAATRVAADDEPHPPPRRRGKRRVDVRRTQLEDVRGPRREEVGRTQREDVRGARREARSDPGGRRALAARRRLLGLLVLLAAGSGALAGTRMAAWWVVVPPSVMLLGYLPLLRAAAHVDAERRAQTAHRRNAGGPAADYSRDLTDPVTYEAHVAPIRGPALAPPAAVIDVADEDQEIYDQYTDAKLRAVGD
jgi:hypothetical protein